MSDLDSGQDLGDGIYVKIDGDLQPLRAKLKDADAVAQEGSKKISEAAKVKIEVAGGPDILRRQLEVQLRDVKAHVSAINQEFAKISGTTLRQVAAVTGRVGGGSAAAGGGALPQPNWPFFGVGPTVAPAGTWGGNAGIASPIATGSSMGGGSGALNPFSNRGLARIIGSGAAVYGASMVVQMLAGMAGAARTAGNAEPSLAAWSPVLGNFDAHNDAYLGRQARGIAGDKGGLEFMKAVEGLPVAGTVISLLDQMAGTSEGFEKSAEKTQRNASLWMKLKDMHVGTGATMARLNFNPLGAMREEHEDAMMGLRQEAARTDPNSDLGRQLSATMREQTAIFYKKYSNADAQIGRDIHGLNVDTLNSGRLAASYDAERTGGAYSPEGRRLRQNAELSGIAKDYGEHAATAPIEERKAIVERGEAAIVEAKAKHRLEDSQAEDEHQNKLTSLAAAGAASRLRVAKEGFAASLVLSVSALSNQLRTTKDPAEHAALRAAGVASIVESVVGNARSVAGASTGYLASAQASGLRSQRKDFEASLLELDASSQQHISTIQSPVERAFAGMAYGARRAEMLASRGRQLSNANFALDTQSAQADMVMARQPTRAGLFGQENDLLASVINADPALKSHAKQVALKQLDVLQFSLASRGGAEGAVISPYMTGINREARSEYIKERDGIVSDLARARKNINREDDGSPDSTGAKNFTGSEPPAWITGALSQFISLLSSIDGKVGSESWQ